MPSLPQQPILASPHGATGPELRAWGDGLVASWRRMWTMLTFTLNALSKVDTLANRTTTPGQNEIFFTTSNTKETFIGVAGAWQMVGPRRGSVTMTSGATTAAVTLSPATADTSYRLSLTPSWNAGAIWYTAKATTGWTVNVGTAPGADSTVDWSLTRD